MTPTDILVTGASGFAGRTLVSALRALGHSVRGFSTGDGDIASNELVFPGVQHVFHLAARTFVPESWQTPRGFYETNVMGAVSVLDFCRRQQASLTLVSSYVYGEPQRLPISEDHPLQAFNPYSHTKILSEEIGRFYARHFSVELTIVRPFNLYGPSQDSRFLIPTLIRQALDPATSVIRVADPHPKRDYIHVDDFVALLLATLGKNGGGTYNAGSGTSTSVEELVNILNRLTGQNKPIESQHERRPGEVMDVVADISQAAAKLDWFPRISLEAGIAGMLGGGR